MNIDDGKTDYGRLMRGDVKFAVPDRGPEIFVPTIDPGEALMRLNPEKKVWIVYDSLLTSPIDLIGSLRVFDSAEAAMDYLEKNGCGTVKVKILNK